MTLPRIPVIGLLLLGALAFAQKPSFEVASIRVNPSERVGGSAGPRGNGFFAGNMTLGQLLMYAYSPPNESLLPAQIIGGPGWLRTDHFDIEAKSEGDAPVPLEQMKLMVQSLLEDRFQLKLRLETREFPVYNLVLAKKGPRLSADQTPPPPSFITFAVQGAPLNPLPRGAMRMVTGPTTTTLTGDSVSVSRLMAMLQSKSDRVILDKTGFTGLFDVHIEFSPDVDPAAPDADRTNASSPSLFTAIQDAGFKLEPAKAPLDALVIKSVQRPSEN